jgi:hypothetical protein
VFKPVYALKVLITNIFLSVAERFKIFIKCIMLSSCLSITAIHAQILKDTASINLIKKGVDYIYNLQFDNAGEVCSKINQSYPGHPVVYLLKGMITYWENYPLLSSSPARVSFETDMRNCIELSEKKYNPTDEAEYLLSNLCARGMLLLFYADNDLSMEVIPLATGTYQYIRRAFDFPSVYSDFFYFTGLYNYYREAYPEAHPVYKSLAFLFPKGNRAKGLKELQKAAKNSIVLKAESSSFLSEIYISYENNYQQASYYSKSLHDIYPANMQYLAVCIKNLLLVKQYDEAESLIISSSKKINNSYYQAQLSIFNGILQEKKYHNIEQAQQYYNKGVRGISLFGEYGNEFAAYAYFGLSRISEINRDKHYKRIYRKQAMGLVNFKKVNFDE